MKKQIITGLILLVGAVGIYFLYKNLNRDKLFTVMEVPDFHLTNQEGKVKSNKDLLGKIYVVEFFFTNCPTICPIMNQNLKIVEQAIDNPDFAVVSITIDPKRDTPEVLKEHKMKLGIDNPNWQFFTEDRDYIYMLSKKFNIYMGEDETTAEGLNHSGKIALIDRKGYVRSRYDEKGMPILYYSGLNYSDSAGINPSLSGAYHPQVEWLIADVKKLIEEKQ